MTSSPPKRRRSTPRQKRPAPALPDYVRKALGPRLRSLRESAGLTQQQVQEATGISDTEVSFLERGLAANPPFAYLLALRDLYEVATLEQLFGDLPSDGWRVLRAKGTAATA
jgi:transcriptional regulator with XRE-family HTH domain